MLISKNKNRQPSSTIPSGQEESPSSPQTRSEEKDKSTPSDRVRLSCDISRAIHRKLRMTAAASDKTILEVVESLVEQHCGN